MPFQQNRLSVDEGVDLIQHDYGVPLSREGLVDICESGWAPCHLDGRGAWTIDAGEFTTRDVTHDLMQRIARLATERQEAEETMEEPPAGAEAEENI